MTNFAAQLHTDSSGRLTSAEYGDVGDGTDGWHEAITVADGGSETLGAKADASVVNTATAASVVSLLKGIIDRVDATASLAVPTVVATTALAASLVVKASAGQIVSISGYSTTAQYLQIHNSTTLPADTAVPLAVIPIAAGAAFSINFGELGLGCSTGIVVCNSTTGPTKTIGAADTFITARYR